MSIFAKKKKDEKKIYIWRQLSSINRSIDVNVTTKILLLYYSEKQFLKF
jgi:hypothetical protein